MAITLFLAIMVFACFGKSESKLSDDDYARLRYQMVENQIERRNVRDKRVLEAMRKVPRHLFVPEDYRDEAYRDGPLPIN